MPKISERKRLLNSIDRILRYSVAFGDEESRDFAELLEISIMLHCSRFLHTRTPREKNTSMRMMLWRWDPAGFRQEVRMCKHSFVRLVSNLETDPIFLNNSRNPQAPCWVQSMIALSFLGCYGNGNSVGRLARHYGAGDGTISKYCSRFFIAIMKLNKATGIITWPNEQERKKISKRFEEKGMPGVVGIVDGTYVILCQRPAIDGGTFWNRKSQYAYNIQLICDDEKRIRYYLLGWPGSLFDSMVLGFSKLAKNPPKFFSIGEFLIADAGYALSYYICSPYRQPAASIPENRIFNDLFSERRVPIEQVNGGVKSRLCSLRGIRTPIRAYKDFKLVDTHILVCLIIHNLMIDYGDDDFEIDEEDLVDEDENENGLVDDTVLVENENGLDLRTRLQASLLNWAYLNNKI